MWAQLHSHAGGGHLVCRGMQTMQNEMLARCSFYVHEVLCVDRRSEPWESRMYLSFMLRRGTYRSVGSFQVRLTDRSFPVHQVAPGDDQAIIR